MADLCYQRPTGAEALQCNLEDWPVLCKLCERVKAGVPQSTNDT